MEALQRLHNRGSISTGYDIDNSLKLESDNSERMQSPFGGFGTPTSDLKYTYSFWIKLTEPSSNCFVINGAAGATQTYMVFENPNGFFKIAGAGGTYDLRTNRFFRDSSAWYHMVIAFDSTQSTASDRIKLYVNGVQETDFSTATYPSQNASSKFYETNMSFYIGQESGNANCYITEIHWIDGQQLTPTDFGEFDSATGIWKPIEYTGTYGNNGFYLDFENAASMGADSSGNGNNFTGLYAISSADQATDTPTNNFCTYNPIADFRQRDLTGFKNGGTQIVHSDEGQWCGGVCTMGVTRGKWYWEIQQYDIDDILLGVHTFTGDVGSNTNPHTIDNSWYYYGGGGSGSYWGNYINGTGTSNSANRGTVWSPGNIIGFALNLDDDEFTFYVNGGSAGASNTNVDISSLTALGLPLIPFIGMWRSSVNLNFGGFASNTIASGNSDANGYGNFEYAPPSGYYALCTKNLAEFG